jgi:hypothetical protein
MTSHAADGVINFAAAGSEPGDPRYCNSGYNSGDFMGTWHISHRSRSSRLCSAPLRVLWLVEVAQGHEPQLWSGLGS